MPRGPKLYFILGWLILAPLTLAAGLFIFTTRAANPIAAIFQPSGDESTLFSSPPPTLGGISFTITAGDARALLVEKFLRDYHSPIQGNGHVFVELADKYKVDWRLVAAIAFQESSLGKAMPDGSYNAWGWAIFTGQSSGAEFDSWSHAIDTVTKGIATQYYTRGLRTPEQIMTRYTPDSNGSWAASVRAAMGDIEQ